MDGINSLLNLLKHYDQQTYKHSQRVASLAVMIGIKISLSSEETKQLRIAAALHDVGKLKVPKQILLKTGRLTGGEWDEIKKHPDYGRKIIDGTLKNRTRMIEAITEGVCCHHERWNGQGYPNGLKGENIPYIARIIAIADAYDAMTSERPYRKMPLAGDEAWGEIQLYAGSQFDPHIVNCILNSKIQNLNVL